jgi:small-conductance mechanosensitive channel
MRRCRFDLQAAANWPPQDILDLLIQIARAHPETLPQPAPQARLLEFGKEMNRYGLSFSIANPLNAGRVTAEVLLAIWQGFASRGILTVPSVPAAAAEQAEAGDQDPG